MRRSWKVHTISRCWNAGNTSWKDLFLGRLRMNCCVGNEDVYLRVLDKRINRWYRIHRPLVRLEHFSPRHKYFSSKYNSHSNEFFIAHQSLLLKKRIHCLFNPASFRGQWNFAYLVSFHYWHNQRYTLELQIY